MTGSDAPGTRRARGVWPAAGGDDMSADDIEAAIEAELGGQAVVYRLTTAGDPDATFDGDGTYAPSSASCTVKIGP